jgi:hypothetical protein
MNTNVRTKAGARKGILQHTKIAQYLTRSVDLTQEPV